MGSHGWIFNRCSLCRVRHVFPLGAPGGDDGLWYCGVCDLEWHRDKATYRLQSLAKRLPPLLKCFAQFYIDWLGGTLEQYKLHLRRELLYITLAGRPYGFKPLIYERLAETPRNRDLLELVLNCTI